VHFIQNKVPCFLCVLRLFCIVSVKVKVTLEQATKAQRGYRYGSTLSLTSAIDGGGWSTPHSGRFIPGKDPVPIVEEAGWAPGPVWTGAENLASHRDSIPGLSIP
jgi:hypothetical protein